MRVSPKVRAEGEWEAGGDGAESGIDARAACGKRMRNVNKF